MEKQILSVSSLNEYIKNILEDDILLSNVIVQGEVTNLNKHYTGHYYFSIKDEKSKVSCMMFSSNVQYLKFPLKEGDLVIVHGYVSLFERQGTYQLYARYIEPFGLGQELLKIEALKRKLKEEGILDLPKKQIPLFPKKIGLVTSSTGAAVKDLIHSIQLRYNVEIDVFPCLVQGKDAPKSIVKALALADNYGVDTIILGRGGGANEDLSAFNDEEVVRAVIACKTPIISAIGHQIDSSVTDLVSDYACITPTEAGIKATPDKNQIIEDLISNRVYITNLMNTKVDKLKKQLLELASRKGLQDPKERLALEIIEVKRKREKLNYFINNFIKTYQNQNVNLISRLNAINPYRVLNKGYSIIYNKDKKIISSLDDVNINDLISIELKDGLVKANIVSKEGK